MKKDSKKGILKWVIGLVVIAGLGIGVFFLINSNKTGNASFNGFTNMKFGSTVNAVVLLDDKDFNSNQTYKRYFGEKGTRVVFEDGMRQYYVSNKNGLEEIILYSTNNELLSETISNIGECSKKTVKDYIWYGKLYGKNAILTLTKEDSLWKLTIKAN